MKTEGGRPRNPLFGLRGSIMGIKYHDNMSPPKYGPDFTLSDNWNPDADYGNEYVEVHFRINALAYYRSGNLGFSTDERERFYEEVKETFQLLGWTINKSGSSGGCPEARRDKANLYLHPQDFSGEMLKREVKSVAEALVNHETFHLEWVDLYQTVFDMTDEEYLTYLHSQDEKIRTEILSASKTARRYSFFREYDIACAVASKVKLMRVGEEDGRYTRGAGKTANYIVSLIPELVKEGYLVSAVARDGSRLIRAINKTEQRQRKLKIA